MTEKVRDQAELLRIIDEALGASLMLRRFEDKLCPNKICQALDISYAELRAYETGKAPIPASKLYLYAHMNDLSIEFFFRGMMKRANFWCEERALH